MGSTINTKTTSNNQIVENQSANQKTKEITYDLSQYQNEVKEWKKRQTLIENLKNSQDAQSQQQIVIENIPSKIQEVDESESSKKQEGDISQREESQNNQPNHNNQSNSQEFVQIKPNDDINPLSQFQGKSPIIDIDLSQTYDNSQSQLINIQIIDKLCPQFKVIYEKQGKYQPKDQQIEDEIDRMITLEDGSFYQGKIINNLKQGYGYHLTDFEFYEGFFEDNKRKGFGRAINQNGYLIGYWQDDKIQNEMESQQKDFSYKGSCQNSIPHGYGELEKADYIYKGQFVNGKKQGKGTYQRKNLNERYEGEFFDDKFNGKGTFYYANGKKYEGMFKNSKPEGSGQMFWPSQECKYYKGEFSNGLRDGKGIFRDSDNSEYDGSWKNDKKHGLGKFTKDGIVIIGKWKDGVFLEEESSN